MSDSKAPSADQAAPFDWRQYLKVHPAADEYPLLRESDPAGFRALVEDIRANGRHMSITFWIDGDGNALLIDGRNRLDVLAEIGALGVEHKYEDEEDDEDDEDRLVCVKEFDGTAWVPLDQFQQRRVDQWSEKARGDPYAIAASLNAHRRHLKPEQYHARIEASHARIKAALEREPLKSDGAHAEELGVSDKTVAKVRKSTPEASGVEGKRIGKDGKARRKPAKKASEISPGFDAARKRAERLGREVDQLASGGFQLTSPNGAPPVCFHSLKRLNQALKDVESEAGTKATLASADAQADGNTTDPPDTDTLVVSTWIEHLHENIAPRLVKTTVGAVVKEVRSWGEPIDVDAIQWVANFLNHVVDALTDPDDDGDDEPPSDPNNGEPEETDEEPAGETPAQGGTVSAVEEPTMQVLAPAPMTPTAPAVPKLQLAWEDKGAHALVAEHHNYSAATGVGEYGIRPSLDFFSLKFYGYEVEYLWPDEDGPLVITVGGKKVKAAHKIIATVSTVEKCKAIAQQHCDSDTGPKPKPPSPPAPPPPPPPPPTPSPSPSPAPSLSWHGPVAKIEGSAFVVLSKKVRHKRRVFSYSAAWRPDESQKSGLRIFAANLKTREEAQQIAEDAFDRGLHLKPARPKRPRQTPPPAVEASQPTSTLHRNPLDGWRKIKCADELEHRINLFRNLAGNKRISFTDAEWDEVDKIRKRVATLRAAGRAAARSISSQSEAVH